MVLRTMGKLNLENDGRGFNPPCHNDPAKKACDNCMGCFAEPCTGIHCKSGTVINGVMSRRECMCVRTQCLCGGRD